MSMDDQDNGKLAYSVEECAKLLSISKGLCYELIRQRRIHAIKLGERRLVIPRASLEVMLRDEASKGEAHAPD